MSGEAVPLTLTLATGDTRPIGSCRINEDGTLDAWENPGNSADDWIGEWAAGAWASVTVDRPGAEVHPIRPVSEER